MKSGRQIIFPSILQNTYIHTDTNSLHCWPCPASLDKITQDPGYMTEILHSLFHCLEQTITSSPVRGNLRRPYNLQSPRHLKGTHTSLLHLILVKLSVNINIPIFEKKGNRLRKVLLCDGAGTLGTF